MLARPRSDPALNVYTVQGGAQGAYHVFKNIFFGPCLALLPVARALPGAITSDAFWRGVPATHALAAQLLQAARDGAAPPLAEVAAAVGDGPAAAPAGAGPPRAHWASLEVPGTKLHVTLVPPNMEAPAEAFSAAPVPAEARGDEQARAKAAKMLVPLRGQWARVSLARYHLARWRDGSKQVGFWEVRALQGLPDAVHFAPQRPYYHVTDKAALVGCTARAAFEILRAMRHGDLHPDWRITTLTTRLGHEPSGVTGQVTVHS